jgi:hypothetical protein
MKFAYVIEDGEIIKKMLVDDEITVEEFVNDVCDEYFEDNFQETDQEVNGVLYTVSEMEMVFLTDLDTDVVEELWGNKD